MLVKNDFLVGLFYIPMQEQQLEYVSNFLWKMSNLLAVNYDQPFMDHIGRRMRQHSLLKIGKQGKIKYDRPLVYYDRRLVNYDRLTCKLYMTIQKLGDYYTCITIKEISNPWCGIFRVLDINNILDYIRQS